MDRTPLGIELDELGGDVSTALQELPVAAVVFDAKGVVRWANSAAKAARSDLVGMPFGELVAPGDLDQAHEVFAVLCASRLHGLAPQTVGPAAGGHSPYPTRPAGPRGSGRFVFGELQKVQ
jgi:hypothetical protein